MAKPETGTITLPDYQVERIGSQIAEGETIKSARPHALTDAIFNYCPGCTHGIVNRLVAECIDELGEESQCGSDCTFGWLDVLSQLASRTLVLRVGLVTDAAGNCHVCRRIVRWLHETRVEEQIWILERKNCM